MGYLLEAARPSDIPSVFSLYEERVRWMDGANIRQWNVMDYLDAYPAAYYREQQRLGNLYVLRDEADGTVMGAAVLLQSDSRWPDRAASPAYYVHNLVTAPVPAAKGLGRQLLMKAEEMAISRGKRFMRLDCAADNLFLNQYYEALGYRIAGHCEEGPYSGNRREKRLPG